MSEQQSLFTPPDPCAACQGSGRGRDLDGEAVDCQACGGTGQRYDPCITRGCETPAVNGPWCPAHDPATRPIPY